MWVRLVREIKCCHSQVCAVILYAVLLQQSRLTGPGLKVSGCKGERLMLLLKFVTVPCDLGPAQADNTFETTALPPGLAKKWD